MQSILKSGLMAVALGGLATVSQAQNGWDQPSTLGSYRPVSSGNISWSDPIQEPVTEPVPDANWNAPRPVPANANGYGSPTAAPQLSQGQGCAPCDQVPSANWNGTGAGAMNGYQAGCDLPVCDTGAGSYGFGNIRKKGFGTRLLNLCGDRGGRTTASGNGNSNLVVGVSALVFQRDLEDDLGLSYNASGQYLFSTDSDVDTMGGYEASIGKRGCNGSGWEASYWSLNPSGSNVEFGSTPYTALSGLSEIWHAPSSASALEIYNNADTHRLYRTNDISNLQFNVLRNGGSLGDCRGNFEFFGGFRWFQFDEDMQYSAFSSYAGHPAQFDYCTEVDNTLLGTQLGGRIERCLAGRLRLATSLTLGIFNNHVRQMQCMADQASGTDAIINSGPFSGQPYNYSSEKNDLAMLGEMNVGGYWMLSQSVRFGFGYRVLGVSGIALAPDQVPVNFTDAADIQRIDSNGSLILHGAYFGLQKCF